MKRNTRHIATVSLAVMAAGFLITIPFDSIAWVRFLRSGFEAGLVGGLADWFAVTALFRHPLGIPIPHTAILPNNREKVTKALVSTVQNDLLSKQSIRDKLKQFAIATRLLDGVEARIRTEEGTRAITGVSGFVVRSFPLEQLGPVLEREIGRRLEEVDTAALATGLVEYGFARNWDGKALDFVLDFAEEYINRESTVRQLGAMAAEGISSIQTSGLMSFALNAFAGFMSEERLGETIRQLLQSQIWELRKENNPTRVGLSDTIRVKLETVLAKPETKQALEQWKRDLVERLNLSENLNAFLVQTRERLLAYIHTEAYPKEVAAPVLEQAIARLREDEAQIERIETFIQDKLAEWIESNHHKIGTLIEENIRKYDNETLIAMLEDKIGSDLQWIRVNGAICGFFIGLVLAAIHLLVA
ncbi:DUF445 domain-containing protein [Paenibacillus mesophilus]|uniref:DUF445 domain-containing protein n=1 Tax=Paenibacillus mesophilus TaxID=2582849 RepID=UPI00110D3D3E|nr:DUF445 domain-containing protein [Paenibacillus mesophilus]TMV46439.1 DUF445 domain-containing protein [Paenibacillus mesophilus]